jgi:tetratricopeptide (TPR) repeat protein
MLGAAVVLVAFALAPAGRGRRRTKAAKASAANTEAASTGTKKHAPLTTEADEKAMTPSGKELRRHLKEAAKIEDEQGAEAAGEYLLGRNLKDDAVDLFMRHELFARAAEVRHDQNRFDDAADLYKKIGKEESAGRIYAQLGRHEDAARCYVAAGKLSVAGDLFERAENHREAGKCYSQVGFHRHAAQAFLKGGADAMAAESLLAAFNEEGGVAGAKSDQKAKEMKGIAKKAGELLAKLERFDEAEARWCTSRGLRLAAKIAFQTGN